MPFIEVKGLGDDYEDVPVAEGRYNLRITDARDQLAKDGESAQILTIVAIESTEDGEALEDNVASVFHYLTFPKASDDVDAVRTKMRMNTRFLKAFNVPFEADGFASEDMPGCTACLLLTQAEWEGNLRNEIVLPKVQE